MDIIILSLNQAFPPVENIFPHLSPHFFVFSLTSFYFYKNAKDHLFVEGRDKITNVL